jgi:hypothetical protein
MKYLKGTTNLGVHFGENAMVLQKYCDANFESGNDET